MSGRADLLHADDGALGRDTTATQISRDMHLTIELRIKAPVTPRRATNELECNVPNVFSPRLEILPTAQQRLWPELAQTPGHFILYGGTAIALRLGHRPSVDFDFFTQMAFEPRSLLQELPYLRGAVLRQSAANTLTVTVDRGGPVQLRQATP